MENGEYDFRPEKLKEYHDLKSLCISFYEVVIVKIDWNEEDIPLYAERNSHGVPEEVISQAARWED